MSGHVYEEPRRYGRGVIRHVTAEIGPGDELVVHLPRAYESEIPGAGRIPYVVQLGGIDVHMERAELERLHALSGRALAQNVAEGESGS